MITSRVGDDGLRDCFRDPIPEIFEAADILFRAVCAHLDGERTKAEALIRAADMPIIGEWLDSIWLATSPYRSVRKIADLPPVVPKSDRFKPRDAPEIMKRRLVARDGHHCRLCGIPLVRASVRKKLNQEYPDAARWTGIREDQQHRGLQVMWLQYDHVIVHSRGGETTMDNLIVTCPACNYGRDRYMMAEVGLRDPRSHPRSPDWAGRKSWHGLEEVLDDKARYTIADSTHARKAISNTSNMNPITIAIQRLPHGADLPLPAYTTSGAAGMDIVAAEALTLAPGARHAVATGFAVAIPDGYEVQVRPRSGLALKHGITCLNSPGTIDSDYRGEVKIILANLGDAPFEIARGDRIAQLVPAAVQRVTLSEVDSLDETTRGSGGFGSTGV